MALDVQRDIPWMEVVTVVTSVAAKELEEAAVVEITSPFLTGPSTQRSSTSSQTRFELALFSAYSRCNFSARVSSGWILPVADVATVVDDTDGMELA